MVKTLIQERDVSVLTNRSLMHFSNVSHSKDHPMAASELSLVARPMQGSEAIRTLFKPTISHRSPVDPTHPGTPRSSLDNTATDPLRFPTTELAKATAKTKDFPL